MVTGALWADTDGTVIARSESSARTKSAARRGGLFTFRYTRDARHRMPISAEWCAPRTPSPNGRGSSAALTLRDGLIRRGLLSLRSLPRLLPLLSRLLLPRLALLSSLPSSALPTGGPGAGVGGRRCRRWRRRGSAAKGDTRAERGAPADAENSDDDEQISHCGCLPERRYSYRNASMGLRRDALMAGYTPKNRPISAETVNARSTASIETTVVSV